MADDAALYETRQLCGYDKPTDEQLEYAQAKAEELIEKMDIGEWEISSCQAHTLFTYTHSYSIDVYATQRFENAQLLCLSNFAGDKKYSENLFDDSMLRLRFSPNGDFLGMDLESPLDFVEAVPNSSSLIDYEVALQRAKDVLKNTEQKDYCDLFDALPQDSVTVDITKAEVGLVTTISGDGYTLVPAISLEGTYSPYIRLNYDNLPDGFLLINLLDGSIIRNWVNTVVVYDG